MAGVSFSVTVVLFLFGLKSKGYQVKETLMPFLLLLQIKMATSFYKWEPCCRVRHT